MKYQVKGVQYVNGYKVLNVPDCPRGNPVGSEGWQYEHILLIEEEIGRQITAEECTHHLDGNRGNNRKENLILMTKQSHATLHQWIDRENVPMKPYMQYPSCTICGVTLQGKQVNCCSQQCFNIYRSLNSKIPDKEILQELINNNSFVAIGKMFGVSDNAVRKWCNNYDIPTKKPKKEIVKKPKNDVRRLTSLEKKWIIDNYKPYDKDHGARSLARQLNVAHTTILDVLKA